MDHCDAEKRKRNPRETANFLSLFTFIYTGELFGKSLKKDLEEDDLYEVIKGCSSKRCGDKMEKQWQIEVKTHPTPSIYRLMWSRYGRRYLLLGCIDLTFRVFNSIVEPYAIANLVAFFKEGQTEIPKSDACFYAGTVLFLNVTSCVYWHNYEIYVRQLSIELKTSFSSLLYRKCLKLTPSAIADITLGNIVTLITKDVETFQQSIWMINDSWNGIVQTFIICYLLCSKIGPVSFLGVGILLSAIPIQVLIGKYLSKLRLKTGKKSDERLQITQETLSTIRIIKMYTWEKYFRDKIMAARKKEVNTMLWGSFLKLVLIIVGVLFSKLGFYALIMSYVWLGYTNTDTELVYYILMIFKDLEYNIGVCIPWGMGKMADCYSALLRINKVISAEELHPIVHTYSKETKPYVEMRKASVRIGDQDVLKDISLNIKSGLVLVTGTVGSGKSSLLKAILQDYPLTSGKLKTEGRLSYASQDPWLFPSSIRQNILFGQKYEEKKYQEVIRVCALEFDFNLLDKGDQTIVTDRGLNLSKGQQARVNLARAVYKDSEIYLLDDSLTALDGHVQDYIFNECIKGYLKDKIVLLVTQTATHIQQADIVVIMSEGKILSCGKPDEKLVEEVSKLVSKDDDLEKETIRKQVAEPDEVEKEEDDEDKTLLECEQTTKKRVYFEVKKKGEVKYSTYKKYIMYGGGFLLLLLNLTLAGLMQGTESYSEQLLSKWVDEKQEVILLLANISMSGGTTTTQTPVLEEATSKEQWTIKLCSMMMLVSTVLSLIKIYTLFDFCRRASINIHKSMIRCILNAVMSFFDTHFIGNVLNRFSQDLNNIDEVLPFTFIEFSRVLFAVTGIIALLATVNVYFLINSFILFGLLTLLRKLYLPTGRSLKRLEAATRSPMIGHLNASLEGLTTIRAYKAQEILTDEFDKHQDLYTSAYFTSLCTSKAFGFFMDSMCSVFIAGVVLTLIIMDEGYTAGDVGLAITQVINLADDVQWGVRQWAEIENLMTSVERLVEYTEIKTEAAGGNMVPEWPSKGAITYDKVNLSYTKHDTVLQDINFNVKPKEKIGIVGRTGAGKSSVISTLFRLYEAEGKILVDDVDIKTLSLKYLRQKIAIIPQDPVMFSGTVRTNLDPFEEYSDKELWDALDKVSLKSIVTNLDIKTTSHAPGFSSGQKQLMCLARAILRRTKIVVLDEATANMDPETDALLHRTIKENFKDCTVITIAHRMHSILDCDRVMVLDRGRIKEYDCTSNLLGNPKGEFYRMVEKAGLLDYLK